MATSEHQPGYLYLVILKLHKLQTPLNFVLLSEFYKNED